MLSLKTGPTLQLAQDMDLEQEEGSLRQRSQPVTVNRGSGWQEALVTRQDYPVYQGAVVVCQGAGSSAVRLAVTEAVAALTGLSTEKIDVYKRQGFSSTSARAVSSTVSPADSTSWAAMERRTPA